MLLRVTFFLFVVLGMSACSTTTPRSAQLSTVEIKEVKPRYMEEADFARIREYFSGQEITGRRMILRSDPEQREGFYFTLVLDEPIRKLPRGTIVEVEVFTPFQNEKITRSAFLPRERPRTREIFFGLTGDDWPEAGGVPSAWKISLKDPRDRVLGTYESFLWTR